jgi:OOP family OmpA-OmpF porin
MKKQIAVAVALACASTLALAQAKQDAGWYVGGSIGNSRTDFSSADYQAGVAGVSETTDKNSLAGRLLLGYNFNKNWALEGAYSYLGRPQYHYTTATNKAVALLDQDAWSFAVKGTVPVNDRFDLFGRLGLTYNRARLDFRDPGAAVFGPPGSFSSSHNNSSALLGLGMEFKIDRNTGIRAEYENYGRFGNTLQTTDDTGRTDIDLWSVGFVVRF